MPTPNYGLKQYTSSATETFGSMVDSVLGTDVNSNVNKIDAALGNKADKVIPVANGNIATLDANGNLLDGGVTVDKLQPAINEITADVSINDGDYVPLYDTGTSTHKKSLWSNIIAKIRAVLFGTSNGILKANGSGVISTATAGTDYAEADHGHSADDITDGVTNKVYTSTEKTNLAVLTGGGETDLHSHAGSGETTPLSDSLPLSDGTVSAGVSASASRSDHVHPATIISSTSTNLYDTNPVLAANQLAFETDTQCFKRGDGVTTWRLLSYTFVPAIFSTIAPPPSFVGVFGQKWIDTTAKKEYVCVYDGGSYIWLDLIDYIVTHSHSPASIGAVPTSRTINGKALSSDITLSASDVSAIPTSGGTISGALSGAAGTDYTTSRFRNITLSTSSPSGGNNGDIWIKYTP